MQGINKPQNYVKSVLVDKQGSHQVNNQPKQYTILGINRLDNSGTQNLIDTRIWDKPIVFVNDTTGDEYKRFTLSIDDETTIDDELEIRIPYGISDSFAAGIQLNQQNATSKSNRLLKSSGTISTVTVNGNTIYGTVVEATDITVVENTITIPNTLILNNGLKPNSGIKYLTIDTTGEIKSATITLPDLSLTSATNPSQTNKIQYLSNLSVNGHEITRTWSTKNLSSSTMRASAIPWIDSSGNTYLGNSSGMTYIGKGLVFDDLITGQKATIRVGSSTIPNNAKYLTSDFAWKLAPSTWGGNFTRYFAMDGSITGGWGNGKGSITGICGIDFHHSKSQLSNIFLYTAEASTESTTTNVFMGENDGSLSYVNQSSRGALRRWITGKTDTNTYPNDPDHQKSILKQYDNYTFYVTHAGDLYANSIETKNLSVNGVNIVNAGTVKLLEPIVSNDSNLYQKYYNINNRLESVLEQEKILMTGIYPYTPYLKFYKDDNDIDQVEYYSLGNNKGLLLSLAAPQSFSTKTGSSASNPIGCQFYIDYTGRANGHSPSIFIRGKGHKPTIGSENDTWSSWHEILTSNTVLPYFDSNTKTYKNGLALTPQRLEYSGNGIFETNKSSSTLEPDGLTVIKDLGSCGYDYGDNHYNDFYVGDFFKNTKNSAVISGGVIKVQHEHEPDENESYRPTVSALGSSCLILPAWGGLGYIITVTNSSNPLQVQELTIQSFSQNMGLEYFGTINPQDLKKVMRYAATALGFLEITDVTDTSKDNQQLPASFYTTFMEQLDLYYSLYKSNVQI